MWLISLFIDLKTGQRKQRDIKNNLLPSYLQIYVLCFLNSVSLVQKSLKFSTLSHNLSKRSLVSQSCKPTRYLRSRSNTHSHSIMYNIKIFKQYLRCNNIYFKFNMYLWLWGYLPKMRTHFNPILFSLTFISPCWGIFFSQNIVLLHQLFFSMNTMLWNESNRKRW